MIILLMADWLEDLGQVYTPRWFEMSPPSIHQERDKLPFIMKKSRVLNNTSIAVYYLCPYAALLCLLAGK